MVFSDDQSKKISHLIQTVFILIFLSQSCSGTERYTVEDLNFLTPLVERCCNNQRAEFLELYEIKNRLYEELLSKRTFKNALPSCYLDTPIFLYATGKFDMMYKWIDFFKEEMKRHSQEKPFSNMEICALITLHDLYGRLGNRKGLDYSTPFYEKAKAQKTLESLGTFDRYENYLKSDVTLDIYVLQNWEEFLGKSRREIISKFQDQKSHETRTKLLEEIDREEKQKSIKKEKIAKKKDKKKEEGMREKKEKHKEHLERESMRAQEENTKKYLKYEHMRMEKEKREENKKERLERSFMQAEEDKGKAFLKHEHLRAKGEEKQKKRQERAFMRAQEEEPQKQNIENVLNMYKNARNLFDFNNALWAHLKLSPKEIQMLEIFLGMSQTQKGRLFER